jgi:hypothetical protein
MARESIVILLCATAIALHWAAVQPVAMSEITDSNIFEYVRPPSSEYREEIKDAVAKLEKFVLAVRDQHSVLRLGEQVDMALGAAIEEPSTEERRKEIYDELQMLLNEYAGACSRNSSNIFLSIWSLDEGQLTRLVQDIRENILLRAQDKIKVCADRVQTSDQNSQAPGSWRDPVTFVDQVFAWALGVSPLRLPEELVKFSMLDEFDARAMLWQIEFGMVDNNNEEKALNKLAAFMTRLGRAIRASDPDMVNNYNLINLARLFDSRWKPASEWLKRTEYHRIWLAWGRPKSRPAIEENFMKRLKS